MQNKILTLHPQGKQGVNIERQKYEVMKAAILDVIRIHEGITFKELVLELHRRLGATFDGSISWYMTCVKLDLEARGLLERIPKTRPQQLRLVQRTQTYT